ncbi:DegT/DnrJ/EryC1/StrS family aminotransferase [Parahaliea aestuarii]|uniref:DegT/DnrJ/EryC1/StrS family aminotransferase n=1 Tax=Parahaliea aestuarii TaxID=1852021 RepID=A0A5C9A376_9GAMM|nr:DegT/DnrJ/EryC1/StrS family aminotransferase [Parahaliea aestuarii]TXS94529.1 DegT/DnrJ/EryC1/StrS family aminotransferase [Parahaliea aestuarii]
MKMPFVDLKAQYETLRPQIQARINSVLEHGQYIMGPEVAELEARLADFTGAKHCISVSSGTDALLISLMALGIGAGDEVITTCFSFVATAEVIVLAGATPVFVDIEADTCNIDTHQIECAITDRTKAIIPVSLYGQPADMREINEIAARHGNIPVIEDAAQSFGAMYEDRKSCNLSTVGCTSFFPSKPLGCFGDGGAVFTSDDSIAEACREIRIHGQSERYLHSRLGLGGRMDTLQCAIVLAKLDEFDREIQLRQEKAELYNHLLDDAAVSRVRLKDGRSSVYGQYTIFSTKRDELRAALSGAGIPSAVHYPTPIHCQPVFRDTLAFKELNVAEEVCELVLSLPMSAYISEQQQRSVVDALLMA